MNYLAHLHIAEHCSSSLAGNLLGDFVKGDPSKQFNSEFATGIKLHRFVDSYTDSHPIAKESKQLFPTSTRRFAPIALDVFWDHYLAKNWSRYHDKGLGDFCGSAHQTIDQELKEDWPERFKLVHRSMWEHNWLESYKNVSSIELVLERMAKRRPRLAPLEQCYLTLERHYDLLQGSFTAIYPDILEKARQFQRQNSA
ncbi:DUF479 domain-containing protein [Vibrio sp. T187]|uniref:acyl carrier protein phosphodiesterase n=1 Tax=Vibrio TaxID=662 RepID=UPI0010C96456|nr:MULTISPECIES: ACP phosphodiesterase [Vibrio]MBW3696223.1 DUF479 domain-containing protein [Vibrio sp. T187]